MPDTHACLMHRMKSSGASLHRHTKEGAGEISHNRWHAKPQEAIHHTGHLRAATGTPSPRQNRKAEYVAEYVADILGYRAEHSIIVHLKEFLGARVVRDRHYLDTSSTRPRSSHQARRSLMPCLPPKPRWDWGRFAALTWRPGQRWHGKIGS